MPATGSPESFDQATHEPNAAPTSMPANDTSRVITAPSISARPQPFAPNPSISKTVTAARPWRVIPSPSLRGGGRGWGARRLRRLVWFVYAGRESPTLSPPRKSGEGRGERRARLQRPSRRRVDLEPLEAVFLHRAVREGGGERGVELLGQVLVGLADAHAGADAEVAAGELRPDELIIRRIGFLEHRNQARLVVEFDVDAAGFEVEIALVGRLVFLDRGDVLE